MQHRLVRTTSPQLKRNTAVRCAELCTPSTTHASGYRTIVLIASACDRTGAPEVSRRMWSCIAATVEVGRPLGFQHGVRREDDGEPRSRMQFALRAKRFESLIRGPPSSSLLLRVETLPGLRTARVYPVVGGNGGIQVIALHPAATACNNLDLAMIVATLIAPAIGGQFLGNRSIFVTLAWVATRNHATSGEPSLCLEAVAMTWT